AEFDVDHPIEWIVGVNYHTNERCYVPIDLVFYPLDESLLGRAPIAEADSSGMAAHTDTYEAARRATLELVERDAIMRNWFKKESPLRISHEVLPATRQKHISKLENQGLSVDVLDMSENGIVIINVLLRNKDGSYPFFSNGSAASDSSFE